MAIGRRNAFFVSVMSLGNAQILQLLAANVKTLACVVPVEEFGSQYGVQILEYNPTKRTASVHREYRETIL